MLVVGSSEDEGVGDEGIGDKDEDMMGYEDKRKKGPSFGTPLRVQLIVVARAVTIRRLSPDTVYPKDVP